MSSSWGRKNTSDMLTKAVEREVILRHLQSLGMVFKSGRHSETPDFNGKTEEDLEEKE